MQKFFVCIYIIFLHLKPDFKYLSLNFVRLKLQINLRLTGKISLKLESNSSLFLEYDC